MCLRIPGAELGVPCGRQAKRVEETWVREGDDAADA